MSTTNSINNTSKKVVIKALKKKFKLATLKMRIIILSVALASFLLVLLILGIVTTISNIAFNDSKSITTLPSLEGGYALSPEVEAYRELVFNELKKYNKEEYIDIVLALMMQESGGRGDDPMQASESKCGYIGCIKNPLESIEYGVKHFVNVLEKANGDIYLALQSYNFGGGFIDYVMQNGGSYSYELAVSFSQMMYEKLKHTGIYKCHRPEAIALNACYGDIKYVDAVLRYLPLRISDNFVSPLQRELVITSPFGWRDIGAGKEFHRGIDLRCTNAVDSIHAVMAGQVMIAGKYSGATSYGNFVTIKHDENLYTTYAHMSSVSVKAGDVVMQGQKIGMCGSTGRSTGPHLHFEIKTEMWSGHKDPKRYLLGM